MGSDDLFRKRRAKSARDLARRKAKRSSYDRVLIVCEGRKTEPNYFLELREYHHLSSANIEVTGDCDSSPDAIFEYAKSLYMRSKREGNEFDRVYCVFDKDLHETYQQTLFRIQNFRPLNKMFAAVTVPCFEYWLLLHFKYSTRAYSHLPGNSAANQVLSELKRHIKDYKKGASGLYGMLYPGLEQAKKWAMRINKENQRTGTDNPSTKIHELVDYLQHVQDPKQ